MSESSSYSIHHDLVIKASLDEVYAAITQPEKLVNWWPKKCSGKAEVGATYNFFFEEPYDWYGEVVKAEEDKSFHIKMTKSDEDWDPTSFGFDLEPLDDKVWVKFRHVGWPACNDHFRRSSFCWAILLQGLKNYVEKGIIVPFEERE